MPIVTEYGTSTVTPNMSMIRQSSPIQVSIDAQCFLGMSSNEDAVLFCQCGTTSLTLFSAASFSHGVDKSHHPTNGGVRTRARMVTFVHPVSHSA